MSRQSFRSTSLSSSSTDHHKNRLCKTSPLRSTPLSSMPSSNSDTITVVVKFLQAEGFKKDAEEEVSIRSDTKACDMTAKALKAYFPQGTLEELSSTNFDLWQAAEKDGSAPYPLAHAETPQYTVERHGKSFIVKQRVELVFEKPNIESPKFSTANRRMSQPSINVPSRPTSRKRNMINFMNKKSMRHSHSSHSSKSSGDNKSIASGSILSGEAEDFDVESVGEIINANSDVWMEEKNGKSIIRAAANVDVIINKISELGVTDTEFFDMFLVTFRHIIKPLDLLHKLVQRTLVADDNISRDSGQSMSIQMGANQIRAINFILKWVQSAWFDFECAEMQHELFELINRMKAAGVSTISTRLQGALTGSMTAAALHRSPDRTFTNPEGLSLGTPEMTFYKFDAREVANALTLREASLFQKIIPQSLVIDIWTKGDEKNLVCRPLFEHTAWFNSISAWVATEIVMTQDLQLRTYVIDMFLRIVKHLRNMRNFNTMYAVLLGLNSGPVQRLKRSWDGLSSEKIEQMEKMDELFSPLSNFRNYRKKLKYALESNLELGAIPVLSIMTKDLIAMNEIPIKLDNSYVNLHKLRLMAVVINQVHKLQEMQLLPADAMANDHVKLYMRELPIAPYMLRYNYSYLAEARKGMLSLKDKQDLIAGMSKDEAPKTPDTGASLSGSVSTPTFKTMSAGNSNRGFNKVSPAMSETSLESSPQVLITSPVLSHTSAYLGGNNKARRGSTLSLNQTKEGGGSPSTLVAEDGPSANTLSGTVQSINSSEVDSKEESDALNDTGDTRKPPGTMMQTGMSAKDTGLSGSLDFLDMLNTSMKPGDKSSSSPGGTTPDTLSPRARGNSASATSSATTASMSKDKDPLSAQGSSSNLGKANAHTGKMVLQASGSNTSLNAANSCTGSKRITRVVISPRTSSVSRNVNAANRNSMPVFTGHRVVCAQAPGSGVGTPQSRAKVTERSSIDGGTSTPAMTHSDDELTEVESATDLASGKGTDTSDSETKGPPTTVKKAPRPRTFSLARHKQRKAKEGGGNMMSLLDML